MQEVAPGVFRLRFGEPEAHTPMRYRELPPRLQAMRELSAGEMPFDASAVAFRTAARGCVAELPMDDTEQFFGLGLQLKSVNHTLLKKTLRMNSDPVADTGDSHAPAPFFVSTRGYGVLVDTLRYAAIYFGSAVRHGEGRTLESAWQTQQPWSLHDCHAQRTGVTRRVLIEVPAARGVDLYFFTGPTLKDAVRRHVLFSGGGALPPLWGLGIWYRVHGQSTQEDVLRLARQFREQHIPCDVLGLEPGWHAHSYACTYTWNQAKFPDPPAMLRQLQAAGYKPNLWQHAFVHQGSPLYQEMAPFAGSHEVWNGIVPDFTCAPARKTFADYQEHQLVEAGVSGFKLDECDNSDFVGYPWSFPEASTFPSGLDGEQYHSLFGLQYQRTIFDIFRRRNQRTLCQVRASHALAAPYPFVLYSDLYGHRDFVRGVVNAGFSGLLWSPEVREGRTIEGLIRRIQSVVLSPHALINAWYIPNPPWAQVDRRKNEAGETMPEAAQVTAAVRELLRLRMALLPYLYAAFARYAMDGTPPFRALAMDYPQDAAAHGIGDQYLIGANLLAAPVLLDRDGRSPEERDVYLPAGEWYHYFTHEKCAGGRLHTLKVDLADIPLFVRAGTILPLAEPVELVTPETVFDLTVLVFGEPAEPCVLFEDDGVTFDFERGAYNWLTLHPDRTVSRQGAFPRERYRVLGWQEVIREVIRGRS